MPERYPLERHTTSQLPLRSAFSVGNAQCFSLGNFIHPFHQAGPRDKMTDTPKTTYGPHNPHPLSHMRTEVVWEGKYDQFGHRRKVNVNGNSMPMQRIETIDEPLSRAQAQDSLFDKAGAHRDDFRNRLIWGDNRLAASALLAEFRGSVDMIYIDPPFDIGADFSIQIPLGDSDAFTKDASIFEDVAYRDTWGKGTDSYYAMIYESVVLLREMLKEDGKFFLHVGDKVAAYVKTILDDVFGRENYRNTIIIPRGTKNVQAQFNDIRALTVGHDYIFFYSKTNSYRVPKLSRLDATPEPGRWDTFWRGTDRPTMRYELFGKHPNRGQWRWKRETAYKAKDNYDLYQRDYGNLSLDEYYQQCLSNGNELKFVRKSEDDVVQYYVPPRDYKLANTIWSDTRTVGSTTDFQHEKHEELLERIIRWVTKEDELVADFFAGSGSTLAVAEKLGRKWIGCDLGRFSIHTTRKRLIGIQRELHDKSQPYRSFDLFNLGRYERQWWQSETLKGADLEHRHVVLQFFKAEHLSSAPSTLIHGRKGTAFVHVDGIDSIFTRDEVSDVARAVRAAGGKQVDCLAWDFEMDLRQTVAAIEVDLDIKIRLRRIPREIMEKNRTEVPPFFEIAVLEAETVVHLSKDDKTVDIKLLNFLPSLTEVPSKELEALQERVTNSSFDFIDFWAIDFDWRPGQPFNHHWQDYRSRKARTLKSVSDAKFKYTKPGKYTACVKVVDVFGCDTSITVEVKV